MIRDRAHEDVVAELHGLIVVAAQERFDVDPLVGRLAAGGQAREGRDGHHAGGEPSHAPILRKRPSAVQVAQRAAAGAGRDARTALIYNRPSGPA